MTKNFIIKIPIYDKDIMFSLGQSDIQFKHSIDKYEVAITDRDKERAIWKLDSVGMYTMLDGGQSIIRMTNYPSTAKEIGTLHHEIFHAVVKILSYIGFDFSHDTDEPAAYLISYIVEEVYKLCKFNY